MTEFSGKAVAVDFDGTLEIGGRFDMALAGALEEARRRGAKLILNTCRTGRLLSDAVEECRKNGLEFDAVNENLPERIALFGGDCRKMSADFYIDDKAMSSGDFFQIVFGGDE